MNILVTGANGQLGSELRRVASNSLDHYIFTDVAELDITRLEAIQTLVQQERVQLIVNCAAYTNVDKAEDEESVADKINHLAVAHLANVAREFNAVLIHISTDYVFGGNCYNTPAQEDQPANPLGAYGRTKWAGEQAILQSGCQYLIFRTSWLYSLYGNNFVKTMCRLTAERDTINVVFDQVGTPTAAADLAELLYNIITSRSFEKHQGIYHFSNEGVISWYDFAQIICQLSGNTCRIYPCHSSEFPSKVQRPSFSVLDKTKLKQTFDVTIPYWYDSLVQCIKELNKKQEIPQPINN